MIKARIRWCTYRVENILTVGKLLILWFCFLLHSILILISQTSYCTYKIISSYELARPVMGTIFLVYHAKSRLNTPVWGSIRSPNNMRQYHRSQRHDWLPCRLFRANATRCPSHFLVSSYPHFPISHFYITRSLFSFFFPTFFPP